MHCQYNCTDPPSGAPVLLVPVIINSTAVSLSWGEVNCTERNGAITGYSVQYSIVGGMTVTVNINATASVVIVGLIKFRVYSFSVAAIVLDLTAMNRSFIQVWKFPTNIIVIVFFPFSPQNSVWIVNYPNR